MLTLNIVSGSASAQQHRSGHHLETSREETMAVQAPWFQEWDLKQSFLQRKNQRFLRSWRRTLTETQTLLGRQLTLVAARMRPSVVTASPSSLPMGKSGSAAPAGTRTPSAGRMSATSACLLIHCSVLAGSHLGSRNSSGRNSSNTSAASSPNCQGAHSAANNVCRCLLYTWGAILSEPLQPSGVWACTACRE